MSEKIKVTFLGRPGQVFSVDEVSFPAGVEVEVDKVPKGIENIKLTDQQRKSLGLKSGDPAFKIEGGGYKAPKAAAAKEETEKTDKKKRRTS